MSNPESRIMGIDLGTTNSEVAAFLNGRISVLGPGKSKLLPSCFGLSPDGELLIGEPARNQSLLYPERTIRSVKRQMGSHEKIALGDRSFLPQEVSAILLRRLADWAKGALGAEMSKAVITVPAFFSDAQRNATREAGALAGLEVVRIINEPTAAALAYGGQDGPSTVMVYDLGGGTFDVSIVRIEGEVTEVLASHGNTRLGGDDFDQLLVDRLAAEFKDKHGVDLREASPAAYSRLWWAAEEAKKTLSAEPYATIREENLLTGGGAPLHFERAIARDEYEDIIHPLVDSTLESVSKALEDAKLRHADLDAILLVGGSTRTPLVAKVLEKHTGKAPRRDMHPDLCVALGAGLMAARLEGQEAQRVLVDVSPYSFGPSYLGERDGRMYRHCYRPIIYRNTPLPITRTEIYYTTYPYQEAVEVKIFQGEDSDALKNLPVGDFRVEGLTPSPEPKEILCRMQLDVDGILHVSAIEKDTGLSKHIAITGALAPRSEAEIAEARKKLQELMEQEAASSGWEPESLPEGADWDEEEEGASMVLQGPGSGSPDEGGAGEADPAWAAMVEQAEKALERSRVLLPKMHADDREEAVNMHEAIRTAIESRNAQQLEELAGELNELAFFVEGK